MRAIIKSWAFSFLVLFQAYFTRLLWSAGCLFQYSSITAHTLIVLRSIGNTPRFSAFRKDAGWFLPYALRCSICPCHVGLIVPFLGHRELVKKRITSIHAVSFERTQAIQKDPFSCLPRLSFRVHQFFLINWPAVPVALVISYSFSVIGSIWVQLLPFD